MADYRPLEQSSSMEPGVVRLPTPNKRTIHRTQEQPTSYAAIAPSDETQYIEASASFSSSEKLRRQKQSYPKLRRPTFTSSPLLKWKWELAASVAIIAAFVALIVTLHTYANKPSPDWPTWLSLNTIVAIYVALLKAGLLFVVAEGLGQLKWLWIAKDKPRPVADLVKYDDASRGPVGAVSLIWRLRTSHILSSLGALITILALAVDPFSQQIIHYYDCQTSMLSPISPSIPRTNYFTETYAYQEGGDQEPFTPALENSIYAGLLGTNTDLSVSCTTGNCTWPEQYSSFACCSTCVDVTDQLTFSNNTLLYPGNLTQWNISTILASSGLRVNSSVYGDPWSQYAIMSPPTTSQQHNVTPFDIELDFILAKKSEGPIDPSQDAPFPYCNTTAANQTLWTCRGYGASRCHLTPCVKTYAATVQAGTLSETVQEVSSSWGIPPVTSQAAMVDTECITASERQSLTDLGYVLTGRWLPYNITFFLDSPDTPNDTFPESMASRKCVYVLDRVFWDSLAGYVNATFTSAVSAYSLMIPNAPLGNFTGAEPVLTVFNNGDVNFERVQGLFENVSLALTNYFRQNGQINDSLPALGVVKRDRTCIKVQWPWLAFPGTLVALTLVFFIVLVFETWPSDDRPRIWKSSLLPLLFYSSSQEGVSEAFGINHDSEDMSARAMDIRVHLDQSESREIRLQ